MNRRSISASMPSTVTRMRPVSHRWPLVRFLDWSGELLHGFLREVAISRRSTRRRKQADHRRNTLLVADDDLRVVDDLGGPLAGKAAECFRSTGGR
jgi:hypothetical protein